MKDHHCFTVDTISHPYWMDRFKIFDDFGSILFDSLDYCHKKEAVKYAEPESPQVVNLLEAILAQLESISKNTW